MHQETYYVDKTTDTFADTLLAYGMATLLDRLLQDNIGKRTVRIRDVGGATAVILEEPISPGYEDVPWFCDLPYIATRAKRPPQGWPGVIVEYDLQRERNAAYFQARKQLPKEALRASANSGAIPCVGRSRTVETSI